MAFLSHLVEVEVFLTCEKRHSFLNFSYVCPEPVLVKCSLYIYIYIYIYMAQKVVLFAPRRIVRSSNVTRDSCA
jgi:hypothetical protein